MNIESSIYPRNSYLSSRGMPRKNWRLEFKGQIQLRTLYKNLNIRHLEKKDKLIRVLSSFKLEIFRKRDIIQTYLNIMKKIENTKGYFTSFDLAIESRRDVGSCRNTILKFNKLKLIKCIKQYTAGDYHEYGRYALA